MAEGAMERLLSLSAKKEPSELTALDVDAFEHVIAMRIERRTVDLLIEGEFIDSDMREEIQDFLSTTATHAERVAHRSG